MKIVALKFEIVRATPAVAEFLAHVELDALATDCDVTGHATGPRCAGVSTVEVTYPMKVAEVGGTTVSLRCMIPEPNLWSPETPFTYATTVEIRCGGEVVAMRSGVVRFRDA